MVAVVLLAAILQVPAASAGQSLGDVNCDGSVNSIDAAIILQFDAGLITEFACEHGSDVNGDGIANSIDATLILQFEAGLVDDLGAQAIAVSLVEFEVGASPSSIGEGSVVFRVENDGVVIHTFRVIRTDLAADELPVDDDAFVVDETAVDVVASAGDLDPGESEDVAVDLEAGSYVLICNIQTHYGAGMFTGFTVE